MPVAASRPPLTQLFCLFIRFFLKRRAMRHKKIFGFIPVLVRIPNQIKWSASSHVHGIHVSAVCDQIIHDINFTHGRRDV